VAMQRSKTMTEIIATSATFGSLSQGTRVDIGQGAST
jgi:hypothetical protein